MRLFNNIAMALAMISCAVIALIKSKRITAVRMSATQVTDYCLVSLRVADKIFRFRLFNPIQKEK